MLNKAISYKFIPAIATLLCACAPAQAVNFHIGVDFPICGPVVRPVYPVLPVPVYVAPRVVRHCHSPVDSLISEIQHDLNAIHADLHSSCFIMDGCRDLTCISRTIKNNWCSWVRSYRHAFGISRRELENISDELRDIHSHLKHISRRKCIIAYDLHEVSFPLNAIADIVTSRRLRISDVRDITMYLSQIQRILATV